MDFALNEHQRMIHDTASRFVAERLRVRASEQPPDHVEIWRHFAEMGWLGLPLPERAGGLGGSFEDVIVLMTALGRAAYASPYVSNIILSGFLLGVSGGERAAHLLTDVAAGVSRVAFADRDSRGGGVRAQARGDGFILNGRKALVYDAPHASAFLVSAATDQGPALFLIGAEAGASLNAYQLIDGSAAADIEFSDVQVLRTSVLAQGDTAAAFIGEARDRAVLANLAQIVGAMEASLDVCASYLKTREQFGQPIGKFQALQHIMSAMFVETQEARSMLYYGLANIEEPAVQRSAAIAAARLLIGEAGVMVGQNGIQMHGGYGMTTEYEIGHLYRRIIALSRMYS